MKIQIKTFVFLFIAITYCLNIKLNKDLEVIEIHLNEEMNRKEYEISPNQAYKLINSNDTYIYFIETKNTNEIVDEENKAIKGIIPLSSLNSSLIINSKTDSDDTIVIYITSILNNINIFKYEIIIDHISTQLQRQGFIFVYVQEDEDQILNLDSLENSLLFYYYKYNFDTISPKDFSSMNKTLFTKYDGSFINLDKNSIYIIYAEIYKFNYLINYLDLFISPKQVNKEILLETDAFYLKESNDFYNITFKESNLSRILKLSRKTKDSEIIDINGKAILNANNLYYELTEDNISNGIQLKVTKNDCFVEILFSSKENFEILDDYSKENYTITKPYTIIKIPKVKSKYILLLSSKNKHNFTEFNIGMNNKISKNSYFYNPINLKGNYNKEGVDLIFIPPYFYNLEMEDEEYQIFEIYFEEKHLKNDFVLTYKPYGVYNYLLKPIDEKMSEYIIGNISSILDKFYIYKDIAKNPPIIENLDNYHHKPINLLDDLNNIKKNNQTYLSLYQEIDRVLIGVRDGHLNIQLKTIENKINVQLFAFFLPFQFYIQTDIDGNPILKMKPIPSLLNIVNNKEFIENFLNDHADIPIKFINKTDPFEYIQNFGKYQRYKSRHAHFSMNLVKISLFHIVEFPYDYSDLTNIEYEFENGDIFIYDYDMAQAASFVDGDKKEFEDFYLSLVNNQTNVHLIPNILQAKNLFMKKKGFLFEEESNDTFWEIETDDGYLKCRVDEDHKYNVFLQTSFHFTSIDNALEVMINCSELFYSNDYKIIGIENQNGGGYANLYGVWHQLIQQKTMDKNYRSMINNEKSFEFFKKSNLYRSYANVETCKYVGSLEELGDIEDDYGYSDIFGKITHKRSKIYDFLDKSLRKKLEKIREKNFEKDNLKKSTDILIYTDSFCFSAGSGFIKAFQNTGGAIIVGFNGNPKIDKNEFDGSQSSSSVSAFKDEEYYNLESLGYNIIGITYSESFDDSYKNINPIPREYTVDIVDERVPIYGPYSDDLYNDFINEAEKIFQKYEIKNECNKNNPRLLLDDKNCELKDKRKGGHPCGEDGKWDITKCEAYYCELGYYYDQIKKECVLDICTNGKERDIYFENEDYMKTKEYELQPDKEMVFHLKNDSYYYFFESNAENIFSSYISNMKNQSDLYMVDYKKTNLFDFEVNANYYNNLKNNATIKVTTLKKDPSVISINTVYDEHISLSGFDFNFGQYKSIYSLQSPQQHIFYTVMFNKDLNIYYSVYNSDLKPEEIINNEPKKFNISSNKLININRKEIGILIFKTPQDFSNAYIFVSPKDIDQNIIITNNRFIYLSNSSLVYNLNLASIYKNIYIKLVKETNNAEIEILDNKNSILNKNNKYYLLDKNTQKLSLKLKNDQPALLEFLYEYEGINYLDTKKKKFELNKGFYALKYKKSDKIKTIKINLELPKTIIGYVCPTIGKDNYSGPLPNMHNFFSTKSEFIFPKEKIDDDENFIIFMNFESKFNLTVGIEEDNEKDNDNGFPIWAIIVIAIAVVLIILLAVFLIRRKMKKKETNLENIEKDTLLKDYSD